MTNQAVQAKRTGYERAVRRLLVLSLWSLHPLILGSALRGSWPATWHHLGIVSLAQPFGDVRVIPDAVRAVREGLDPYRVRTGYPSMNYPRLWIPLFARSGLDRHVLAFEIGVITLLLASFSHLILSTLRWSSAVCVWLGGISWVVFLVVERGNTDMVAFVLIYAAAVVPLAWAAVLLLTFAALLKLFPGAVFLVSPFAGRRPRIWYGAGLAIVVLSVSATRQDLFRIENNTPHTFLISYGVSALLLEYLPAASFRSRATFTLLVALVGGFLCWWGVRVQRRIKRGASTGRGAKDRVNDVTIRAHELFLVFGAIFVATFLLTPNFLYRLIFLVPTLPFWCELASLPRWRFPAGAAVALTLLGMDSPLLHHTHALEPWVMQVESCARVALYPVYSFFLGWTAVSDLRRSRTRTAPISQETPGGSVEERTAFRSEWS